MTSSTGDLVLCPACGEANIRGTDRCTNCMLALRALDMPDTMDQGSETELAEPLLNLRLQQPPIVAPDATVREAVDALREHPGASVLVIDGEGWIRGIFTERDVLKKIAGYPGRLDQPVSLYMTPDPVMLRDTDTVAIAIHKMGTGGFRHIPLLHEGKLAGVLTGNSLARWMMERYFS